MLGHQNVGVAGNPNGFVGIPLVDVAIPLPNQPFVVLRRIHLVDHRWIVHGNGDDFLIMLVQDCPGALARGFRALEQLAE